MKIRGYKRKDGTYVRSHWRRDKPEDNKEETAKDIYDARRRMEEEF